jgi:coronafacic acid polyketide synthase Cfa7
LPSVASGRIAYTLGLNGPAVTVDTACSSSLTAVHLACQSLRAKECSLAIAGGVTVMATPEVFAEFSRQGGLAADGRCKAFGDGADGTGFAEGVGLLLLQRLSDAVEAGHPVLAVIRGSAINQDGASNGLTAPHGPAQEQVIRQALASAGLTPSDVDAVEGHGTGTVLGDPIEANALINTYGQNRPADRPLWLGSLKSNIGHTQAAAGVAGIIKTVLALRHGELPKTLHADVPTSKVDWSRGAVRPLTEQRPWPDRGRPRRAGVSSFGLSGTNAHLILEQAPPPRADKPRGPAPFPALTAPGFMWPLSAASLDGVRAQAAQLSRVLTESPEAEVDLAAVGFSLATTRAHLDHRAVLTAADRTGMVTALDALAHDRSAAGVTRGVRTPSRGTAFLFSGQGCQWPGMGRGLHANSPVFAQALDEACAHLDPRLEHPLQKVMFAGDDTAEAALLDRTDFTQAALFALEVALFRTVESVGLRPDFVAGHSVGEIAAAHVAGVLSLPDAAELVAARGRLMRSLPATGAMITVEAREEEVLATLSGYEDRVTVAAVNAPSSTVISGDRDIVVRMGEEWRARGRRIHRLRVSHAFHSPHMDPVVAELGRAVADLGFRAPAVPVVSTLTGTALSAAEACSPGYWARQARGAVRFADAVGWLRAQGATAFVEIGPDAVLTALGQSSVGAARPVAGRPAVTWTSTLRRGRDEPRILTAALARLHVRGARLDWTRILPRAGRAELPTYPFQHRRYWLRTPTRAHAVGGGLTPLAHPFLDAGIELAGEDGWLFTGTLSGRQHPWLLDHEVGGTVVAAGAATAEMVLYAGTRLGCARLDELLLHTPLPLPGEPVDIQVRVGPAQADGRRSADLSFRLPSGPATVDAPEREWTRHATGTLAPTDTAVPVWPDLRVWPPADAEPVDIHSLYGHLAELGITFGPAFQLVTAAWRHGADTYLEARLPSGDAGTRAAFDVHPALLDGGLQGCLVETVTAPADERRARMILSLTGMRIHTRGVTAVRAHLSATTPAASPPGHSTYACRMTDDKGKPVATIESLALRAVDPWTIGGARGHRRPPYLLAWREAAIAASRPPRAACWIVPDDIPSWLPHDCRPSEVNPRVFTGVCPAVDALTVRPGDDVAILVCAERSGVAVPEAAHRSARDLLAVVQRWLADARTVGRFLVVMTHGAVAAGDTDDVPGLAQAPVWGLLRTAQSEHPGRFVLLDIDDHRDSWRHLSSAVAIAAADGEPQLALRSGRLLVPRLTTMKSGPSLTPPAGHTAWRPALPERPAGSPDELVLAPCPAAETPLAEGRVRVAVRAVGVTSRDLLIASETLPEPGRIGVELSGVVVECGPGVGELRPGDRVMGLARGGATGSLVVTDHRLLARVPGGWTFAQAATVPVAFLTAWEGLVDTGLRPGETVLIHDAAGDVGMAAVQIALHLGADVHATGHPAQHAALRALGLDDSHITSSEEIGLGESSDARRAGSTLDDSGVAVPQNSGSVRQFCSHEPNGNPEQVSSTFARLADLFRDGVLGPLPLTAMDIRQAPRAMEFLRRSDPTGKVVLTLPRSLDPEGTVLITGGTGALGALAARRLVTEHRVRHLLLVSRRGSKTPGSADLYAELTGLGAQVTIAACDAADRDALAAVLDGIPTRHPLTAVVHAAGTVDPAGVETLTPNQIDGVMAKADAAWHLHQLTERMDLAAFVLYSSSAGILGLAGQGNYAAANAFVDALACHRRGLGLPATALAWGMWDERSRMGERLGAEEIRQLIGSGIVPMSAAQGLAQFDAVLGTGPDSRLPLLVPVRLDTASLRAQKPTPLLSELITTTSRPSTAVDVAQRFAALPESERPGFLLDLVTSHAGAVLNHHDPTAILADSDFRSLGMDSVTAVEMRNRLADATGLRMPASVVFDHPTLGALANHLGDQLTDSTGPVAPTAPQPDRLAAATLGSLLGQAVAQGRTNEGIGVLAAAARLRPSFSHPPRPDHLPAATWLRRHGRPALICVEPFIPGVANLTYQRLATALDGQHDVAAVRLPGYHDGEALPATVDAAAEALATCVEACSENRPFTLVGFSTGGFAAHAAAHRLEARGIRPEAVVLIDSLSPSAVAGSSAADILREWLASGDEFWSHDDAGLTAMGWYLDLFGPRWTPAEPVAPVFFVEAAEQVPSAPAHGWARLWPGLAAHVTTPGRHFTLLTDQAPHTARTITDLLHARRTFPTAPNKP